MTNDISVEQERIAQLSLEINQCKAHIAAHTGDKQLLLTYLHGDDANKQRWEILQMQLRYVVDSAVRFIFLTNLQAGRASSNGVAADNIIIWRRC